MQRAARLLWRAGKCLIVTGHPFEPVLRRCGRCFLSSTSDPSGGWRSRCSVSQRFLYSPHVSDVSRSRGRDLSKICSATSIFIAETVSRSHYNRSHNRGCFGRWPSLHKVRILYVCINGDVPFHAFLRPARVRNRSRYFRRQRLRTSSLSVYRVKEFLLAFAVKKNPARDGKRQMLDVYSLRRPQKRLSRTKS